MSTQHLKHFLPTGGVGNCSVSDTINTLGGGPAVFKTLTIMVGNCGGVTLYMCKTLTIMVGNCGGVTSYLRKTLTIMVKTTLTTMVQNTYHHGQGWSGGWQLFCIRHHQHFGWWSCCLQNKRGGIFKDMSHTLTIFMDKWGGPHFFISKTLTHMMVSVVVSNSETQKHLPHGG